MTDFKRYEIDGWHIVDSQTPGLRFYIRELIEIGCDEFDNSETLASERLRIIEAVGQEQIIALLRENFKMKRRTFNEKYNALDGIQKLKEMVLKESNL